MWTPILIAAAGLLSFAQGVCREKHNEIHYYDGIGCLPEQTDVDGCPISYNCGSLDQRSKDKCHWKGRAFDVGQTLESSPEHACLVECGCQMDREIRDSAQFDCVNVECPDEVGRPVAPGCYRTYAHGSCCHAEEICPTMEAKTSSVTCNIDGKTLHEGQQFYPESGHCLKCICQSGFNGSLVEPWCRPVNCQMELVDGGYISEGCAPVFYGPESCCPIEWRCPNATLDSIISSTETSISKSGKTCKFGKLTLEVGEHLNNLESYRDMVCTCSVPPHVVCVKNKESPKFRRYF